MSCESNLLGDILQPLPKDKWPLLKSTLQRDWPHYAYYYYWVYNAMKWKKKDPRVKLDILCPGGKHDAGVFVGISTYSMYMVIPFAFRESKSLLYDCLVETSRIDWCEAITFAGIHEYCDDAVMDAIEHKEKTAGLLIDTILHSSYYFKSKEDCLKEEINIPEGLELRLISQSDLPVIYEQWPREELKRNPEKSNAFLLAMIKLNRGIGLFEEKSGKLVAWGLQTEMSGLGNMQTIDECRRRGYAKIVAKALSKLLALENVDTTLFIVSGNSHSERMFGSLNYRRVNSLKYVVTKALRNYD